ncbi:hypothetical protein BFS06_11560 [Clostridium perfringens]|uniref:hypothetical protein n=1 Tax=Clostridium perfringens TaxID=1502 RepID=UPI00103902F4|nr:hypothetical protein [Clostridium perfringens]TBX14851.1 hypothetical protein BFS06_11560 [Clostridium perfringens]
MNKDELNCCDYCGVSKYGEFTVLDVYNDKHKLIFSVEVCCCCFNKLKDNNFKDDTYEYKVSTGSSKCKIKKNKDKNTFNI